MQAKKNRRLAWTLAIVLLLAAAGAALWLRGPSLAIAPLYQIDYLRPVSVNGASKSVASSGCGVVCLAMALDYLGVDPGQTPQTLFEDAVLYGDYLGRAGISQPSLVRIAQRHGADGEWVARDAARLRLALLTGHPVICHMGAGSFTTGGHYVLLRAISGTGMARVNDPASEENTAAAFPLDLIFAEAKGDEPFMIVRRAAG